MVKSLKPPNNKFFLGQVLFFMTKLYTRPKQYSLSRVGLEIYETDEENFEPYISSGLVSATKSTTSKSTTTSEDGEDTEAADTTVEEDTEEDDKGFKLHQGEIKTKFLYADNISDRFILLNLNLNFWSSSVDIPLIFNSTPSSR